MISHTTQAVSKKVLVSIFSSAALLLTACQTAPDPPPAPEMSQVQVRQLQMRAYDIAEEIPVMKAIIAALQDEGFIISAANLELGLITAAMEIQDKDEKTKWWTEFFHGPGMGTYQTTKRFEASATVQKRKKAVRVRINIIAKTLTNTGGIMWSQPVYNPEIYHDIFAKMDKSIFLAKENI